MTIKISYKKNTLTWYRSFKLNFFKTINLNNNLNIRRTNKMNKTNFNKFIKSKLGLMTLIALFKSEEYKDLSLIQAIDKLKQNEYSISL